METQISRAEHEEFVKRIEEENHRQNRRIEILEKSVQQLSSLTASVEKLAYSIEGMVREQERREVAYCFWICAHSNHRNRGGIYLPPVWNVKGEAI